MKLFIDDLRPTPEGWIGTDSIKQAIEYLQTGKVTHLSLDYDYDRNSWSIKGWYWDIMKWLLDRAAENQSNCLPTYYRFHTSNPDGRRNYRGAFDQLRRSLPTKIFKMM